jgi:hypothetical protein
VLWSLCRRPAGYAYAIATAGFKGQVDHLAS